MNLIFAEAIMAMFGIPINFTASVMHGWKLGKTMCNVFGFALTLGGMLNKYNNDYIFKLIDRHLSTN